MYRYIPHESCSQFDSLPLTSLTAADVECDEELLLNYRLHPMTEKPEWYAPVDEEEDKRVWGTSDASWRIFGRRQ